MALADLEEEDLQAWRETFEAMALMLVVAFLLAVVLVVLLVAGVIWWAW